MKVSISSPLDARYLQEHLSDPSYALWLAQNPRTPGSVLAALANRKSKDTFKVYRALAKNPSTPTPTLLHVCRYYPDEFLQNPLVPLLVLEDPTFFERQPLEVLSPLLRCPRFASEHLATLSNSRDRQVQLLLTQHPNTPAPLLERLAKHRDPQIAKNAIIRNHSTPPETLCQLAESEDRWVRQLVLQNKRYPKEHLSLLLRAGADKDLAGVSLPGYLSLEEISQLSGGGPYAQQLVALHPLTPPSLFLRIMEGASDSMLRTLSLELTLPKVALSHLAKSKSALVRRALGNQKVVPAEVAERLAKDPEASVRASVAQRGELSPETRAELSQDREVLVRVSAAKNLTSSIEALLQLSQDQSKYVRAAVAKHPQLPAKIVGRLFGDPSPRVRRIAAKHPSAPQELLALYRRAGATYDLNRIGYIGTRKNLLRPSEVERLQQEGPFARALLGSLSGQAFIEEKRRREPPPQDQLDLMMAQSPDTPVGILRQLAACGKKKTQQAARRELRRREEPTPRSRKKRPPRVDCCRRGL